MAPAGVSEQYDLDKIRPAQLRLVVSDTDGTRLDPVTGEVPEEFWPVLAQLQERGIDFVPASGRQYATLARAFADHLAGLHIIADNGAYVVHDQAESSSNGLDWEVSRRIVTTGRELIAAGARAATVISGKRSAYVEADDPAVLAEAGKYYAALERVEDLLQVDDDVLKIAIFDADDAQANLEPALAGLRPQYQVVVSGQNWVDVMGDGVTKGDALGRLQKQLGVTAQQPAVFGDYLNDIEMLDRAEHSFAVANAHPEVFAHAKYVIPTAAERGVVAALQRLLAR